MTTFTDETDKSDAAVRMMELIEERNRLQEELNKHIMSEGKGIIMELLEVGKHPLIQFYRWTQYTPYFNDGEPCVFSVHDPGVCLTDQNPNDYRDYEMEWSWDRDDTELKLSKWTNDSLLEAAKKNPELLLSLKAFGDAFWSIPKDVMEGAFGDHIQVTYWVQEGRIDVDEYDHD